MALARVDSDPIDPASAGLSGRRLSHDGRSISGGGLQSSYEHVVARGGKFALRTFVGRGLGGTGTQYPIEQPRVSQAGADRHSHPTADCYREPEPRILDFFPDKYRLQDPDATREGSHGLVKDFLTNELDP